MTNAVNHLPLPLNPLPEATGASVVLADTSSSMEEIDGTKRRIEALAQVLGQLLAAEPALRVIAFHSLPEELPPGAQLPEPGGSTAFHLALDLVATLQPRPGRLVIISDGEPDDAQAALAAARALRPITIDGYYVGPADDHAALGFMRALSLAGGRPGIAALRSLRAPEMLADEIRLRLAGPVS